MVEVTIQKAQVSCEAVEDIIVLRAWDGQFRWNICLDPEQVDEVISELTLVKVAV